MAKSRRSEPSGSRAAPSRKGGAGLQSMAFAGALAAVVFAFLGAFLAGSGDDSAALQHADSLGAGLVVALTAIEPEWWQDKHDTWVDMWNQVKNEYPPDVREAIKAYPQATKDAILRKDHAQTERNKERLRNLYSVLGTSLDTGTLRGLQLQFNQPGYTSHSLGARVRADAITNARPLAPGSRISVGSAQATAATGSGTFPARVYACEYKDARGQRVGDAYAILSQAALEGGGGGMGPWTFLTPLLVALAVGLILYQVSQATQGLQGLARDLEAIGRGKLDLRVAVKGPAEVGVVQRAAERMAKNLQLIQTTGSGDLDEALAKELDLATQIHQSLRPADPPRVPGYEIETLFKPGRDIGGDYFDYIELDPNRLAVVIADCSEGIRGVPAAMVMAMTRAYLQTAVNPDASPADWLKAANRRLARDLKSGMAVTCQIAVLNSATGEVVAASAGHRPIVMWRQGKTATINPNGIALGLDVGPVFDKTIEEKRFTLQKNDRIVLHTDGVVSAQNEAGETYGEARFQESIRRQGAMNSAAFVNFVGGGVDQFLAGFEQNDDITVVTCKRMK